MVGVVLAVATVGGGSVCVDVKFVVSVFQWTRILNSFQINNFRIPFKLCVCVRVSIHVVVVRCFVLVQFIDHW